MHFPQNTLLSSQVLINIDLHWGLFSDFRLWSRIVLLYNFFFCLRWLLYALVIIMFIKYPVAQAVLFLLLTLPVMFYQLIFWPFRTFWGNFFGFFNEVVLVFNAIGFFVFLTPNTGKPQNAIGWVLIVIIGINYVSNVIYLWIVQFISLIKLVIWCCLKLK